MKHHYDDIELAYDYVSCQPPSVNSALICRKTGRIYYLSDIVDSDEDVPEDIDDADLYVSIPHKYDFDLGTFLVHQFIADRAPNLSYEVSDIFSRRGAYSRFKVLLESEGLLEDWYEYEKTATDTALRAWCQDNDIELADHSAGRDPAGH